VRGGKRPLAVVPALPVRMNDTDIKWVQAVFTSGICKKHDKLLSVTVEVPREGHIHFVTWRCESTITTPCDPTSWEMTFNKTGAIEVTDSGALPL
jgi:hypothetical protein